MMGESLGMGGQFIPEEPPSEHCFNNNVWLSFIIKGLVISIYLLEVDVCIYLALRKIKLFK
jgi:hypothetical protein